MSIAATPAAPYYAVIFTSIRSDGDNGYGEMAHVMLEAASSSQDSSAPNQRGKAWASRCPTGTVWNPLRHGSEIQPICRHKSSVEKNGMRATRRVICRVERDYDFSRS
jgi:hypothetical protein